MVSHCHRARRGRRADLGLPRVVLQRAPQRRPGADHRGRHARAQRDAPAGGPGRLQPAARRDRRRHGGAQVPGHRRLRGGRASSTCSPASSWPRNCKPSRSGPVHGRHAGGGLRGQRAGREVVQRHPRRLGQPAAARLPRQLVPEDARRGDGRRLLAQRQQVLRERRQPLLPRSRQRRRRGHSSRTSRHCRSPTASAAGPVGSPGAGQINCTTTWRRIRARRCGTAWCR